MTRSNMLRLMSGKVAVGKQALELKLGAQPVVLLVRERIAGIRIFSVRSS